MKFGNYLVLFKFSGQNLVQGFRILKKFQTESLTKCRSKKQSDLLFFKLFYFSGSLSNQTARPQAVFQGQLWIDKKKWKKDKSERKKPKFTKFLSNNCFLYIVYLSGVLIKVSLLGVISYWVDCISFSHRYRFPFQKLFLYECS